MNEFNYSESPADGAKKKGRPTDPNALKFRSVGLRTKDWEFLRQWELPADTDGETGNLNYTAILNRAIEDIRYHLPAGSGVRHRDALGRWTGTSGREKAKRPTRRDLTKQIADLEKRVEELQTLVALHEEPVNAPS